MRRDAKRTRDRLLVATGELLESVGPNFTLPDLARQAGVDEAALDALLRRLERARFAAGEQPDGDGVADLAAVAGSLRAGASTRRRLLATLLPQSLAGRAPVVPAPGPATLAR